MPALAACDGGGGKEDAQDAPDLPDLDGDGEADPAADPNADGEDVVEADEAEAEDTGGEEEVPVGAGTCADPVVVGCAVSLGSETTEGAATALADYACTPFGADETGPERVYRIDVDAAAWATVTMTPSGDWDLDLWVLDGACDPEACSLFSAGISAEELSFRVEPGTPLFVVVDGYSGEAGGFSLSVDCSEAEDCGNGTDDTGNGLSDCEDSQCWGAEACTETCSGGADEDLDGLVDCEDAEACAAAPGCLETLCGDDLDDDGDTLVDCADFDCAGSADCTGGSGAMGDPCTSHDQCADGACLLETFMGWPGGYCSAWSFDISLCGYCPAGSVSLALGMEGPCYCARSCTVPGDCRPGYVCQEFEPGVNGCLGGCTDSAQCTATGYCSGSAADPGSCEIPPEVCTGGSDEDGDTLVDCDDPQCIFTATCAAPAPLGGGGTCAEAAVVTVPSVLPGEAVVSGSLAESDGDDHDPVCDMGYSTADVWYTFTLATPARVIIDLMGAESGLDVPVLSLARSCEEPDLRCSFMDAGGQRHAMIEGLFTPGTYVVIVEADIEFGALGAYTLGFGFSSP